MSDLFWHKKDNDSFFSKICVKETNKFNSFSENYSLYLEKWHSLSHPSMINLDNYKVLFSQDENQITCLINLKNINSFLHHYNLSTPTPVPKMHLIEKLFILYQTIDLAIYLNENAIDSQFWDLKNMLHHSSIICKWFPLPPGVWLENNNSTFSATLVHFAFDLFDILLPKTSHEWDELERQQFFPHEWSLFFQECLKDNNYFENHPDEIKKIAKFIFFQSWIYTNSVRFCMRDKELKNAEYILLERLRNLLKIEDNQSNILDIFSLTPKDSWDDYFLLITNYF